MLIIAAKVLMSRLGIPYETWRTLGIFRHGGMDNYDYALRIFRLHLQRAFGDGSLKGKTILEIGPGDSLASAVIGRAYGAERIILIDAGVFATQDMRFYRYLAAQLSAEGLAAPDLSAVANTDDMLRICGAQYLISGAGNLAAIPTGSVDYVWSHSVLEHIPRSEVAGLMHELRRVLKPRGLMSHNIDFQDHLDHSLNSLRFSETLWESALMRDAGFYTNRIRAGEMHGLIRSAGFETVQEGFGRWPSLPVSRERLDPAFRATRDDDLLIRTSHILARAAAEPK